MPGPTLKERYLGALIGLACGDAIGTTVEFSPRGSFTPVTGMVGGGPFRLKPGQWTDDTSMALCLAESLLTCGGFDARDQMGRYLNWWQWGYLSSTGECFDIGITTRAALERFQRTNDPFSGATDPDTAGNGSLMRLAPVVLYFYPTIVRVMRFAAKSSLTTHAASEAVDCCRLLAFAMSRALAGHGKHELVTDAETSVVEPKVRELARESFRQKARDQIRGTGYAVASLEAALWCVANTDSFEAAVLAAVNLGDDADTTGAITGQLAGAMYGIEGVPFAWRERLHMLEEIKVLATRIHDSTTAKV
jgi:ADP-ribosyl-[dinitrogen reductase] hydrolase